MAVAFHTHDFEIPTASSAEVIAGTEAGKVVTPAALGPLATLAGVTPGTAGLAVIEDETASDVRTTIGVVIGTDVQAFDTDLTAIAALTSAADKVPYATGAGTWALADFSAAGRALVDDASAAAQRVTLGFDSAAPGAAGLAILADAVQADVRDYLDVAPYIATRTALKALDTTKDTVALFDGSQWKWTTGDFSVQIAADTAEGIYAKADAIAATVGAWVRVYDETPLVNWWGAVADYTVGGSGTDSTTAIQCAVNVCNLIGEDELRFKPSLGKKYLVTATITGTALLLSGTFGAGIVFKNMSGLDGFSFTGATSVGKVIGAERLELIAEGANIQYAIRGPNNSAQYSTYYTRYVFNHNYCHGGVRDVAKYSFAWDYSAAAWIYVGDCNGALISWNNIQGAFDIITDPTGQFADRGIYLNANAAILSARIHNNNIGPIKTGVDVGDKAFLTMSDNDIIGSYDGLSFTGATLFNEPKIQRNNFNAQRWGIILDGPDSIEIVDNTIRRHSSGWKGATHDWYGVKASNVSDLKLSNNTVQPDESGGAFTGTMYAYALIACGLSTISDNFVGVGCDRGFLLDNCTGFVIDATVTAQNDAADILFRLINNTRASSLGSAAYVSSFAGTKLSDDGSINYATLDVDKLMGLERLPAGTVLTIAAGVITVTQSYHTVETEGAAGTDDLVTITPSSWMNSGAPVFLNLRPNSSARDVVLKDGTGNLRLTADFTMTHSDDWIELVYENSVWKEVSRSDNTA